MASRRTGRLVSSWTVIRTGSRPNAFPAATKYAAEPTLSFKSSSVSSIIMASTPIPAITAKCSGGRSSTVILTIYQAYLPVKGDLDGVYFLKWKVQVSSQQVAGAGRYQ